MYTEWRTTRGFLETGKGIREKKHCGYCGKMYQGGPDMIRAHLLAEIKPRSVGAVCQPNFHHRQTYKEVCAILRGRLQNAKRKAANEIKAVQNTTEIPTVFNLKPSAEQVTEQWMGACVKNGLPLCLVDCVEFRAAIAITARAGPSYVDATGEPKLIARTPDCDYTLDGIVTEWCKLKTALPTKSFGIVADLT